MTLCRCSNVWHGLDFKTGHQDHGVSNGRLRVMPYQMMPMITMLYSGSEDSPHGIYCIVYFQDCCFDRINTSRLLNHPTLISTASVTRHPYRVLTHLIKNPAPMQGQYCRYHFTNLHTRLLGQYHQIALLLDISAKLENGTCYFDTTHFCTSFKHII